MSGVGCGMGGGTVLLRGQWCCIAVALNCHQGMLQLGPSWATFQVPVASPTIQLLRLQWPDNLGCRETGLLPGLVPGWLTRFAAAICTKGPVKHNGQHCRV
jgi:hypothetical protein